MTCGVLFSKLYGAGWGLLALICSPCQFLQHTYAHFKATNTMSLKTKCWEPAWAHYHHGPVCDTANQNCEALGKGKWRLKILKRVIFTLYCLQWEYRQGSCILRIQKKNNSRAYPVVLELKIFYGQSPFQYIPELRVRHNTFTPRKLCQSPSQDRKSFQEFGWSGSSSYASLSSHKLLCLRLLAMHSHIPAPLSMLFPILGMSFACHFHINSPQWT